MRLRWPNFLEGILLLFVVWLLGDVAYTQFEDFRGERDGNAAAEADLASGKLALQTGGLHQPWSNYAKQLFSTRYGVEAQRICGCCPTGVE